MLEIRKVRKTDKLPDWFETKRWKNAKTQEYLDEIENFYAIFDKEKMVGAAQIVFRAYTNKCHLGSLYIDKTYRGKKLGQKLLLELLKSAKSKKVYLDTSKKHLISYYKELGFQEIKAELGDLKQELKIRHPEKDVSKQIFMVCNLEIFAKD